MWESSPQGASEDVGSSPQSEDVGVESAGGESEDWESSPQGASLRMWESSPQGALRMWESAEDVGVDRGRARREFLSSLRMWESSRGRAEDVRVRKSEDVGVESAGGESEDVGVESAGGEQESSPQGASQTEDVGV